MTPPHYKKGRKVKSLKAFVAALEKGKPFYWRHKFMAAGFIEHWTFSQIKNSIKFGVLSHASINKKEVLK